MKSLEPSGYGETFESLVSRLRSDFSARQKSAPRTNGNGSSSSQWRTPAAGNGECGGLTADEREGHTLNLQDQVQSFQGSAWPTPTANDWKGSGPTLERADGKLRGDRLDYATEQLWSTPRASDGEKGGPNQSFGAGGMPLPAQALDVATYVNSNTWPTPTAMNRPRSDETLEKVRANRKKRAGQNTVPLYLEDLVVRYSPLVPQTMTAGETHSKERRSLNPRFVSWLMGWPIWWTTIAWINSDSLGTELSRYKRRMRLELCRIGLPREAPAEQLSFLQ